MRTQLKNPHLRLEIHNVLLSGYMVASMVANRKRGVCDNRGNSIKMI